MIKIAEQKLMQKITRNKTAILNQGQIKVCNYKYTQQDIQNKNSQNTRN